MEKEYRNYDGKLVFIYDSEANAIMIKRKNCVTICQLPPLSGDIMVHHFPVKEQRIKTK